jgi:hypothetical protein
VVRAEPNRPLPAGQWPAPGGPGWPSRPGTVAASGPPWQDHGGLDVERPSPAQARVLSAVCHAAAAVTAGSATVMRLAYAHRLAPPGRVVVVPHGTPAALANPDPLRYASPWPLVVSQVPR